jgi:hypothetical protein
MQEEGSFEEIGGKTRIIYKRKGDSIPEITLVLHMGKNYDFCFSPGPDAEGCDYSGFTNVDGVLKVAKSYLKVKGLIQPEV